MTGISTTEAPAAAALHQQPHSAWHSPVPYLFGGLAAMLGLIAFALLILACSYWKLSGYLDDGNGGEGDLESGEGKPGDSAAAKPQTHLEERIVVIMAGDHKPTFLATPISSRASSFGDNASKNSQADDDAKKEDDKKPVDDGSLGMVAEQNSDQTQEVSHQNQNREETPQEQGQ